MTLVWFVVWIVSNTLGDAEHLTFAPVNVWAGSLLFVVALDLGRQHAAELPRPRQTARHGREEP